MSPIFSRLRGLLAGDGLRARSLRGVGITFLGYGAQQFFRLLSNLVLTRLLFPEAFGLMALVTVVLTGVQMFTDTGINTSIVQSRRGDDPAFLNTAWSVQILRGALLGLIVAGLAGPLARFYDEPQLGPLLRVAALNAVLMGFQSTRMALANRHLMLGRLTVLLLGSQLAGIVVMIALAYLTGSVWALLIGTVFGTAVKVILSHTLLAGPANRPAWEGAAFRELFHFGKFIFIASAAGFLVNNADRAVLGKFISIGDLGIYNIGFFIASVPMMLARQFGQRVLFPLYARIPVGGNPGNFRKIRRARLLLTSGQILLAFVFSLGGEWLIGVLYQDTYALAGPVTALLSLSYMPVFVTQSYDWLLLAAGNSRRFTVQKIVLGGVQLGLLVSLIQALGVMGAIVTPALAALLTYPLVAAFARREGGWDPKLDLGFLVVIGLTVAGALLVHDAAVATVLQGFGG